MKICSQIIAVFCTAAVALTSAGVTASAEPASAMRDMTTMELVREMGLEPTRPVEHKHLKLACLPIPAHSQIGLKSNAYSL